MKNPFVGLVVLMLCNLADTSSGELSQGKDALSAGQMLSEFQSQYPYLIDDTSHGLVQSLQDIKYVSSTLKDREDLAIILQGLEVKLDKIEKLFHEWETRRRDTIAHLSIHATEIDKFKQSSNYGMMTGSTTSVLGGGLVHWGLAGMAGPGAVIGGMVVTAGSHLAYTQVANGLREQVSEYAKEDGRLTNELNEELAYLHEYIGQLGRWIQTALPSIASVSDSNLETFNTIHTINSAMDTGHYAFIFVHQNHMIQQDSTTKPEEYGAAGVAAQGLVFTLRYINPIGMAINGAMAAYVAHDLWKGSRTEIAEHLSALASTLEGELEEARKIYRKIQKEGRLQEAERRAEAAEQELRDLHQQIRAMRRQTAAGGA